MHATEFFQGVVDALSLGGIYALTALSMALIFGIMRLVNLAQGELIMIAGYTISLVVTRAPLSVLVLAAVVTAAWAAFAMERIAFRPVRSASPTTLMVTSFGVSYFLQNLAIVIFGSQAKPIPLAGFLTEWSSIGPLRIANLDIVTIVTTFGLLAALAILLRHTALGLRMRAAAEDFRMARLLGVRANSVIALAFVVSGALSGVVAILLIARTGTASPTMGTTPLIIGVVAVVVGGMESLAGAVLGGVLLGFLTTTLQILLPLDIRSFRDAVAYTAVIVFLLVRPNGIMGPKAGRV